MLNFCKIVIWETVIVNGELSIVNFTSGLLLPIDLRSKIDFSN